MSIWGPGYHSNRVASGYGPSPPWNASGLRIENVGSPEEDDDAVTKGFVSTAGGASTTYVDSKVALRVLKAGDTMTGDLRLNVGTDPLRLLGCTDLASGKGFSIALGNLQNQLQFAVIPVGQTHTPVTMETTHGFMGRGAGQDVCQLGAAGHKNIVMNNNQIKSMQDPTAPQDAATQN